MNQSFRRMGSKWTKNYRGVVTSHIHEDYTMGTAI